MRPPTRRSGPTRSDGAASEIRCFPATDPPQGTAPVRLDAAGWATKYAAAGLAVLSLHSVRDGRCSCGRADCRTPGKHPRTLNGLHDASTELGRVAAWWRTSPWANVGARPHAGQVVVDVDRRTGGLEALDELTRRHGPLPPTLCARTGGGGLHYWFRHSGPIRGRLVPGIDLKGCRGYLVMPPSIHASGRRYEWLTWLPIAPAPGWLSLMIGPPPPAPRPPVVSGGRRDDGLVRAVASAPEGRRNDLLNWATYRAYERGGDPGLIAELRAAALNVGLSEDEVDRTIASAARAVSGR
jgi:Bifunctional DNA primase/polymerase, N-terminal